MRINFARQRVQSKMTSNRPHLVLVAKDARWGSIHEKEGEVVRKGGNTHC